MYDFKSVEDEAKKVWKKHKPKIERAVQNGDFDLAMAEQALLVAWWHSNVKEAKPLPEAEEKQLQEIVLASWVGSKPDNDEDAPRSG